MDKEKYRSPQYPPIPPVSEASTYIGVWRRGNLPRMKEKWSPLFRESITCQTWRQIDIINVSGRVQCGCSGVIYVDKKVRSGRPKGSTYAANSSLPTIRSRSFDETRPCLNSNDICSEYFAIFLDPNEQILRSDVYCSPRITMVFAGPLVLDILTRVWWCSPAEVT